MPDPEPPPKADPRFPWRAAFDRTTAAVFVVGADRRLRYANPAWGTLTGRPPADARGMRVSARRSAGPLAQAIAPPPEVWHGQPASVRRPPPDADAGPPWWDVTFTPLPNDRGRPPAVVGVLAVVGADLPKPRAGSPAAAAAVAEFRRRHAAGFPFDLFAGASPAAGHLLAQARLAARTRVPVWIVGEPGSGKETLARVIHHNGPRGGRAFVGLDCGGLQPYLIDGMLFGKGGLVGSPHLGTLYLKEPAALPRDLQERIAAARGVRLVCGSARPAADAVAAGRLVPTYQSALAVLELRPPPLRGRLDDLPKLVARLCERFGGPAVADDVWPALRAHAWPGNVRELADVLQQAAEKGGPITRARLTRYIQERQLIADHPPPPADTGWTLDGVLEAAERRLIELALRKANGSLGNAAAALGVPRPRLARRVEALGISNKAQGIANE
jgi:transcriptional regulator with AAA-type ATPase domain